MVSALGNSVFAERIIDLDCRYEKNPIESSMHLLVGKLGVAS